MPEAAFVKRFLKSPQADLAKEKCWVSTTHTGSQNKKRINLEKTCRAVTMAYQTDEVK